MKDGTVFQRHRTLRGKGELVLPSISDAEVTQEVGRLHLFILDGSVWSEDSLILGSSLLLFSFTLKPLSAGVFLLLMLLPNTTPEYFT